MHTDLYGIGGLSWPEVKVLKASQKGSIHHCVTLFAKICLDADIIDAPVEEINVIVGQLKKLLDSIVTDSQNAF